MAGHIPNTPQKKGARPAPGSPLAFPASTQATPQPEAQSKPPSPTTKPPRSGSTQAYRKPPTDSRPERPRRRRDRIQHLLGNMRATREWERIEGVASFRESLDHPKSSKRGKAQGRDPEQKPGPKTEIKAKLSQPALPWQPTSIEKHAEAITMLSTRGPPKPDEQPKRGVTPPEPKATALKQKYPCPDPLDALPTPLLPL